jgi:hypothetical protein
MFQIFYNIEQQLGNIFLLLKDYFTMDYPTKLFISSPYLDSFGIIFHQMVKFRPSGHTGHEPVFAFLASLLFHRQILTMKNVFVVIREKEYKLKSPAKTAFRLFVETFTARVSIVYSCFLEPLCLQNRVTRLGEFSPIGGSPTLAVCYYEASPNILRLFPALKCYI